MENRNYNIVIKYISKEFGIKERKLGAYTSLSDLGLDGDDVLDFLLEFFDFFEIEYEDTNYKAFIPREGGGIGKTLSSIFNRKVRRSDNEIFIQDLVISLDKKKWCKIWIS
ncbi:DUF1493 family protein [Sphingobacterium deserti]|nr:DUF1493 family protein [Sphingobacterium deserti]